MQDMWQDTHLDADTHHIYERKGLMYNSMLNQTDIGFGVRGHNKFYAMQIIENDERSRWYLFRKWGRVGAKNPQNAFDEHISPQKAIENFLKYFKKKTGGNVFGEDFDPVDGKYSVGESRKYTVAAIW